MEFPQEIAADAMVSITDRSGMLLKKERKKRTSGF